MECASAWRKFKVQYGEQGGGMVKRLSRVVVVFFIIILHCDVCLPGISYRCKELESQPPGMQPYLAQRINLAMAECETWTGNSQRWRHIFGIR